MDSGEDPAGVGGSDADEPTDATVRAYPEYPGDAGAARYGVAPRP